MTLPMYLSSVMGKSVPGIDIWFASPRVRSVRGSSDITSTTLWTMTLSAPSGRSKTIMSPTETASMGSWPCTSSMSLTSRAGTMLPLATT